MTLNKKNIFLFDGIGALTSLISTGLILPLFSEYLGIPKQVLYFLAGFPLLYLFFSFGVYFFSKETKSWQLKTIMMANFFYCLISAYFILNENNLTFWGQALLVSEIIIIAGVILIEYRVLKKYYD